MRRGTMAFNQGLITKKYIGQEMSTVAICYEISHFCITVND